MNTLPGIPWFTGGGEWGHPIARFQTGRNRTRGRVEINLMLEDKSPNEVGQYLSGLGDRLTAVAFGSRLTDSSF